MGKRTLLEVMVRECAELSFSSYPCSCLGWLQVEGDAFEENSSEASLELGADIASLSMATRGRQSLKLGSPKHSLLLAWRIIKPAKKQRQLTIRIPLCMTMGSKTSRISKNPDP